MNKIKYLKILVVFIVIVALGVSCSKKEETVRIGYLPITDASPLLVAHDQDLFTKQGLTSESPVLIRNWSLLVEAFAAGKVNVVHLLIPIPVWMRYNKQIPVKIIAWNHSNGSAITIGEKSDIEDFSGLAKKQIAVPYWYSIHNIILQLGLRQTNLTPTIQPQSVKLNEDEVNLFVLPPPDMPVALASGEIDGFVVAEPFNALAEQKMNSKILRFTGDIWKNHPCCVVVVKESLIKNNPEFVQKVTNGVVEAQSWILQNREEAAKLLSKDGKNYLPVPEKVLLRVFTGYENEKYGEGNIPHAIKHPEWNGNRIGFQPYPYESAVRVVYNEMKKNTLVEGNKDFFEKYSEDFVAKDLIDPSFAKKAIMDLGGPGLFPEIDDTSPWEREEIIDF